MSEEKKDAKKGGEHGGGGGGHKKKKGHGGGGHGEGVNLERWLVSYADFMTLLFCVFTVLYALSVQNKSTAAEQKIQEVAQGVMMALGGTGDPWKTKIEETQELDRGGAMDGSSGILEHSGRELIPDTVNKKVWQRESQTSKIIKEKKEMEAFAGQITEAVKKTMGEKAAAEVQVEIKEGIGVTVTLPDKMTFDAGDALIRPDFVPALDGIATILETSDKNVSIQGHTDNLPSPSNGRYYSNWELSVARASSVLHYLLENYKLAPEKFSASGYGEFRPAFPNTSATGREKNRRVEIVIGWN